ncbi:transcription elongation factor Spt5 [Candidatus Aenigmatarchaeota archaeon]
MIATVRTTTGRENVVVDSIIYKVNSQKIPIKAIFRPEELKGYVFIEGEINDIEASIKGIPHVRGLINRPVESKDIEKFIIPEKSDIKIEVGDIVEIISSPFKGEKAKITRVDETKNEVTVEFMEAAVPIPVTISKNSLRLHQKAKNDE